jgi:aspartyl-tRNA(Asn)/glutamyl-tRNA(Gln) amidotransferase subunit B
VLAHRFELGDFYEQALAAGDGSAEPKALANWVKNELVPRLGDADPEQWKVEPPALARLVSLVESRSVSGSAAKQVLDALVAEGGDPERIVEEKGLAAAGQDELAAIVEKAIADDPAAVEQVRGGNQKAIGAIVGAVMRETKGRADGGEVQRMIRERIGA